MLESYRKTFIAVFFIFLFSAFSSFAFAQNAVTPTLTPSPTPEPTLPDILDRAEKQTSVYRQEFANILADETKIFEEYDKNGRVKDSRRVESNFLVYQSLKDANLIREYRNVIRVDGKAVGDSERRAADFFDKVLKSTTVERELDRIREESNRYDETLDITGLTLYQTPIVATLLRPVFDFRLLGKENYGGAEVFVVEYQQTKESPYLAVNDERKTNTILSAELSTGENDLNGRYRGKMWIDATTFQVLREVREATVRLKNLSDPVVALRTEFEYQPSEFGTVVPKRIVVQDYALKIKAKEKEAAATLKTKLTFEYTKFTKSDVEVKGDVK